MKIGAEIFFKSFLNQCNKYDDNSTKGNKLIKYKDLDKKISIFLCITIYYRLDTF